MPCLNTSQTSGTFGCIRGSRSAGILPYPKYKTCGNRNPYYKYNDFYYSVKDKRNISRCQMEDYWSEFLFKGISAHPNENIVAYYTAIVLYIRAMFDRLANEYPIYYSNLSSSCSALLLIKRCLERFLSQEEISRIMVMMELDKELEECAICE